jgi:3-(3-hydroxy-phenyl)propionate hydroxylase
VDNLSWKLAHVIKGLAPDKLLDSYDDERIHGADENIMNSTRSTDFITPKSDISRVFRNAVLDLSEHHAFARPLVNSGRLSMPCNYVGHSLTGEDALLDGPTRSQPGMPCPDAPLDNEYLLSKLGGGFTLMTLNTDAPSSLTFEGLEIDKLALSVTSDTNETLGERFLGAAERAVYLIRPDQHIVARWSEYDAGRVQMAVATALGKSQ